MDNTEIEQATRLIHTLDNLSLRETSKVKNEAGEWESHKEQTEITKSADKVLISVLKKLESHYA